MFLDSLDSGKGNQCRQTNVPISKDLEDLQKVRQILVHGGPIPEEFTIVGASPFVVWDLRKHYTCNVMDGRYTYC